LGLAIVRDLATEIGGSVEVADREAGGAVFLIRIPSSSHQE
jgi:signal transduction histidine kinase